jgi:hypothetical protein
MHYSPASGIRLSQHNFKEGLHGGPPVNGSGNVPVGDQQSSGGNESCVMLLRMNRDCPTYSPDRLLRNLLDRHNLYTVDHDIIYLSSKKIFAFMPPVIAKEVIRK